MNLEYILSEIPNILNEPQLYWMNLSFNIFKVHSEFYVKVANILIILWSCPVILIQKRRTEKKKLVSITGRKTQNGGEQKRLRSTEEDQREDSGHEEDAGPGATG